MPKPLFAREYKQISTNRSRTRTECGMARQRVGKTGKAYGVRMELVWSLYGVCMEYVWNNTLTTRQQQAGHWLGLPCLQGGAQARCRSSRAYLGLGARRDSPSGPGAADRRQRNAYKTFTTFRSRPSAAY